MQLSKLSSRIRSMNSQISKKPAYREIYLCEIHYLNSEIQLYLDAFISYSEGERK